MKKYIPIILLMWLSGCSDRINLDYVNKAQEMCESNGGLKYISPTILSILPTMSVYCKNGAKFEDITKVADKWRGYTEPK